MLQAEPRRAQRLLGLRDELIHEMVSIAIFIAGILLLLSLASENSGSNLIGRLGSGISSILTFVLGQYVAYIVPLLCLGFGVTVWRGQALAKVPMRIMGLFFAATSICAILAIPNADLDLAGYPARFRISGAIGNFLMHRDCLNLKGYLGIAGSHLLFGGMLLISLSMITDSLLRPAIIKIVSRARLLHPRHWLRMPSFLRRIGRAIRTASHNDQRLEFEDDEDNDFISPPARPPVQPSRQTSPQPMGKPVSQITRPLMKPIVVSDAARVAPPRPPAAPVPRTVDAAVLDALEAASPPKRRAAPPQGILTGSADLVDMAEEAEAEQQTLPLDFQPYEIPGLSLLNTPPRVEHRMSQQEMEDISERLENTLAEFGISAQVVQVTQGPTVTRFEMQPAAGVKVARILALENDIAMCMKAESVRIIAPIPGKAAVGLEIPNRKCTPVFLREILASEAFRTHSSPLAFALGKTISGEPYICDLAAMPHLLIAGATGSGKSVCLNSIICSILFHMEPEKVKMIMIDPKRVELNVYQAIPHLLAPVVCEPRKAAAALTWALEQMEDRYKRLAALGVRNIDGYNAIVKSKDPHPKAVGRNLEYMPHIVIIIDELADLMIIARNEVEDNIIRLAQMSRAVGMHLILATQRPSVNVITGIIKANFPSRVAFQVSSKVDSRTILDTNGAEALLGRGDMLFSPGGSPKPIRLQGCFMSDEEVERVADWVRLQQSARYVKKDFHTKEEIEQARMAALDLERAEDALRLDGVDADDGGTAVCDDDGANDTDYTFQQQRADGRDIKEVLAGNLHSSPRSSSSEESDAIDDQLFREAVRCVLRHRKASVSLLQRKLKIGFARAGRVMDMMEDAGIVGPNVGSKVREILVDTDEYLAQMDEEDRQGF